MDGGATNFGAPQYPGTYSKSTMDDKLFNIMGEMNNAVPLSLHPFIQKAKCCAVLGIWIEQCTSCSRNLGFIRPYVKIWKNVGMDYCNVSNLDLTCGKEEHLALGWHVWSIQHHIMLCFKCHSCPTFMIFHECIALMLNCVKVWDLHKPYQSSIHINCAIHITHTHTK